MISVASLRRAFITRLPLAVIAAAVCCAGCASGIEPRHYTCHRADEPIVIDGDLGDAAWRRAPWTDDFVDITGNAKRPPRFKTRAKMPWDDQYFYIGAQLEEPHVWGTLIEHDAIVFNDNEFEVFIDPDGDHRNYYEVEINALGTIFDLLLVRTYHAGGPAWHGWDLEGLKSAVRVDGTLNDSRDAGKSPARLCPRRRLGSLAANRTQKQLSRSGSIR
jgi:hypothetical protein